MNQQNPNAAPEKRVPTEAEIARAEREAVAAMLRGEKPAAPRPPETPADAPDVPAEPDIPVEPDVPAEPDIPVPPEQAAFVPYVDDVPEPEPAPEEAAADAADDDDDEYIPGEMEKRIDAMPPEKWRLWQIAGGAAVGLAAVAALFVFGEELSTYGIVVAALLALLLPRYLERAWRHPLNVARRAMVIAMIIGLAVMFVIIGARTGFSFRASK